tara:strand:- start:1259 stop:1552 length:294 start_codon:yes stop_codon:yes gene_type:complete
MVLNEIREQWERGFDKVVGVFPLYKTGTTCVILRKLYTTSNGDPKQEVIKEQGTTRYVVYFLHRYFPLGDEWQCAVDVNGSTLEACVVKLSAAVMTA